MKSLQSAIPLAGGPINQLPAEITHMLFAQLRVPDIISLRLVCKVFAAIGLHYVLPDVRLIRIPQLRSATRDL